VSPTTGLPIEKLHPAGKNTVASMSAKGWAAIGQSRAHGILHYAGRAGSVEGADTTQTMSPMLSPSVTASEALQNYRPRQLLVGWIRGPRSRP